MTTIMKKLSLLTASTALLAVGSMAPANAFQLKQFDLNGTTGNAYSPFYQEYQNASFTGYIKYDADGVDQNPNSGIGKFPIIDLFIKITNPNYPGFTSKITLGKLTSAFITQDEWIIAADDAQVENSSTYNPKLTTFQLFFNDQSNNPDLPPTQAPLPGTFKRSASFFTLLCATDEHGHVNEDVPPVAIPVTSASVTGPVAAVPEPTTMVGAGIFGVGLLLKRRPTKSARKP